MSAAAPCPPSVPARTARPVRDLATGSGWDGLPDRDLDRAELLELDASVAAQPGRWRPHVAFGEDEADGGRRHYVCLHRDAHVDVWLLCWNTASDTGWHDHDVSSGAVVVAQGALVERNLTLGAPGAGTDIATEITAGYGYAFGPDHIHRLTGRDAGSVSLHAYSPPLWRMGQYAVTDDGMLRRTSVSYADELRPIDG